MCRRGQFWIAAEYILLIKYFYRTVATIFSTIKRNPHSLLIERKSPNTQLIIFCKDLMELCIGMFVIVMGFITVKKFSPSNDNDIMI